VVADHHARFAPNLRRLEGGSEAEAFCRNPEQKRRTSA